MKPISTLLFLSAFALCSCQEASITEHYDGYTLELVSELPDALHESSGIIFWRGLLWTFNDSGNEPILYGIDTINWQIQQRIQLGGAENYDWEDITQDENYLYIGDFGNNYGNRRNLRIYRIAKKDIFNTRIQSIIPDSISFYYSDQEDFSEAPYATAFDCESVFVAGDSLYLITKDWLDGEGSFYRLPKTPGSYTATPITNFSLDGLITAAEYDSNSNTLVVSGSNDYVPFFMQLHPFHIDSLSAARGKQFILSDMTGVQIEAITYRAGKVWMSCEQSESHQSIFQVQTEE